MQTYFANIENDLGDWNPLLIVLF